MDNEAGNSGQVARINLTLFADVVSTRSNKKGEQAVYAKKGHKVALISDRGNVLIVEDNKGNRFPVKREMTDAKDMPY